MGRGLAFNLSVRREIGRENSQRVISVDAFLSFVRFSTADEFFEHFDFWSIKIKNHST